MEIKGKPLELLIPEDKVLQWVKELAKEIEDYFAGPFFVVSLL